MNRNTTTQDTACSYCLQCQKAYYQSKSKYNPKTHSFVCPNCGGK